MVGDILALTALGLFAVNAFVVRFASLRVDQGLGFLVALVANVLFAGLVVAIDTAVRGIAAPTTWRPVLLFLVAGLLSTYLGRRGYFRSVQSMGPARATAFQVTNPVFALVLAWLLVAEQPAWIDLGAVVAVVVGLVLTSRVRVRTARPIRLPAVVILPAVLAAASYGAGNVARGAAVDVWPEPIVGGFLGAVSGTVAYATLHAPVARAIHEVRAADPKGLLLWSLAGVITISGQVAVIAATRTIPIATAVAISSALPILVIPASRLLLGDRDPLDKVTVTGSLLVIGGVVTMVLW